MKPASIRDWPSPPCCWSLSLAFTTSCLLSSLTISKQKLSWSLSSWLGHSRDLWWLSSTVFSMGRSKLSSSESGGGGTWSGFWAQTWSTTTLPWAATEPTSAPRSPCWPSAHQRHAGAPASRQNSPWCDGERFSEHWASKRGKDPQESVTYGQILVKWHAPLEPTEDKKTGKATGIQNKIRQAKRQRNTFPLPLFRPFSLSWCRRGLITPSKGPGHLRRAWEILMCYKYWILGVRKGRAWLTGGIPRTGISESDKLHFFVCLF